MEVQSDFQVKILFVKHMDMIKQSHYILLSCSVLSTPLILWFALFTASADSVQN